MGWTVTRHQVSRQRLLARLEALLAPSSHAHTLYLPPGGAGPEEGTAGPQALGGVMEEVEKMVPALRHWDNGAALFWDPGEIHVVVPPFPLATRLERQGWDVLPLRELMLRPHTYGAIMVRLGRYAVGVYRDEVMLDSKTASRYVKGKHKKGGQSQQRFARIREKQARELFDTACTVAREKLGPYEGAIERLFLGGDSHTLDDFCKRCRYMETFANRTAHRLLDVREPNFEALKELPRQALSCLVFTLRPE